MVNINDSNCDFFTFNVIIEVHVISISKKIVLTIKVYLSTMVTVPELMSAETGHFIIARHDFSWTSRMYTQWILL